jgi:hypothetical protein
MRTQQAEGEEVVDTSPVPFLLMAVFRSPLSAFRFPLSAFRFPRRIVLHHPSDFYSG